MNQPENPTRNDQGTTNKSECPKREHQWVYIGYGERCVKCLKTIKFTKDPKPFVPTHPYG